MTHVHTEPVRDQAARQASRYDREKEAVFYVDTLTSKLLDGDSICQTLWIICLYDPQPSAEKVTISSVQTALKRSEMTRRHRLAYVHWARRHFIWPCVGWNRVSFSGETRFALSTNKRCWDCYVLERNRFGGWGVGGKFRGFGWKNEWPEDVLCCHARQFQCIISTKSCDLMPYHFSIIFTHRNWSDIWYKLKQNKKAIECNVFFCAKFPERCGYFELKRNKCNVPVMPMMCLC